MGLSLSDVTAENFFKKITYASDASPGTKLPIPDGEFILCAIMLKLDLTLNKLKGKFK